MSDDFQVKQSTSGSGAYGLTGGAIGAAAGGFGSYYLTKPKYGTFDDLVAEKQDSFVAKLNNAKDEDKKFLDAVNELRNVRANASKEYDDAIKAATEGVTPVNHDAQKAVDTAKQKLENKKKALIDAEVKKRGGASVDNKEIQNIQNQLNEIKNKQKSAIKKINEKLVKLAEEKNKLATEYANATTGKEKKEIINKLNKIDDKIRLLSFNKDLGFTAADTEARKDFINKMKDVVANLQAKQEVESVPIEIGDLKKLEEEAGIVSDTLNKYKPIAEKIDARNNAVYDEIRTAITNKDKDGLRKAIEKLPPEYQAVINKIKGDKTLISEKELNRAITEIDKQASDTLVERIIKIEQKKFNKESEEMDKVYTSIKEALAKNDKKALEDGFNKLPVNQQEKLKELLKNGWVQKDFEEAIPQLKDIHAAEHNEFKASMESYKKFYDEMIRVGGEGAHIVQVTENGKTVNRIVDKDGNPIGKKLKSNNMKTRVNIPENIESVTELNNKLSAIKEPEQKLREEIAKGLKESDYQAELDALKNAEKAAEEAKKNAANTEKLSLDKATEEVNKKFGVKDKAEFINTKAKSEADNITNNFKKQIERKWGFAEHTNLKIAGAAVAGALVLGSLFSAMSPKSKA